MKSNIKIFILTLALGLLVSNIASADLVQCGRTGPNSTPCQIGDLTSTVFIVVNFLVGSATALAMGYIVYGGVRMVLSRGNDEQVKIAKSTMTNAIIGLIIVVMSYLIIGSVISYFTGYSFDQLRLFFRT